LDFFQSLVYLLEEEVKKWVKKIQV
jgi:hypothetical protein